MVTFITLFPLADAEWHLLLIDEVRKVGTLPPTEGVVYCIEKVSLLPLALEKLTIEPNIEVRSGRVKHKKEWVQLTIANVQWNIGHRHSNKIFLRLFSWSALKNIERTFPMGWNDPFFV